MSNEEIPQFKFALREDLVNNKEFLPTKAEPLATGWDVRAAFEDKKAITLLPFDKVMIPLGIRTYSPEGWWLELKPRSSSFTKKSLHALYGTVDCHYSGMMYFCCQYIPKRSEFRVEYDSIKNKELQLTIEFGEALGQLIPVKRKEMSVEEISNEEFDKLCIERGAQRQGGFGSTDKKVIK